MEKKNTITLTGKDISVSVSVYLFKEGDTYIAYCPSLDISGYDTTEDSAKKDFEYMLREWIKEQLSNGTLQRDLQQHGWKIGQKTATEPSVSDMLRRNRAAEKILSMPEFRKMNIHTGVFC